MDYQTGGMESLYMTTGLVILGFHLWSYASIWSYGPLCSPGPDMYMHAWDSQYST